jgi:hypothetical protein
MRSVTSDRSLTDHTVDRVTDMYNLYAATTQRDRYSLVGLSVFTFSFCFARRRRFFAPAPVEYHEPTVVLCTSGRGGRFSTTGSAIVSEGLGRRILGDEISRSIPGGANIGNWMIIDCMGVCGRRLSAVFSLRDRLPRYGRTFVCQLPR